VIGDGTVWIWNLADQHFPSAIQIVDLFRARQHLWELSARPFPQDEKGRKRWMARCLDRLDRGKIEALVASAELARIVANEAEYFARNAKRMRYPAFREQGLFVGSGVVEAGCKTVIGAAGASSSSSSSSSTFETLRVVLDCGWRQLHHRFALLPLQLKVRRLSGKPLASRLITNFSVARP